MHALRMAFCIAERICKEFGTISQGGDLAGTSLGAGASSLHTEHGESAPTGQLFLYIPSHTLAQQFGFVGVPGWKLALSLRL